MPHSLIAGDAAFAVVLAAWWRLRRSAHLLPHLRKGPSSYFFNPGPRSVSWIMAIITVQPLLTIHRPRRSIPTAAGPGPTPERVPTSTSRTSSTTRASSEPPTCPFPVVGPRASGSVTLPIGRQVGPPRSENWPEYAAPPSQPAVARRGDA